MTTEGAAGAHRRPAAIPAQAGIGLRYPHHQAFQETRPAVGWVEVHSENYLNGPALSVLEAVRADYPVSLHSVGLSLGSAEGVDTDHLDRIAMLAERIEPGLISEHVAWGAVDHTVLADLLPLPLTEESLAILCRNVDQVQARLRRKRHLIGALRAREGIGDSRGHGRDIGCRGWNRAVERPSFECSYGRD